MEALVDISRLQFAFTALIHFLFVPLTLGLSLILVVMESLYVKTGQQIYKDMTKFWGKLFAINFAMGVVTGLTMEFQFGTNWAYYSHYVGDIFGVPLAIEGMMAFFLESTFIGLFFFGWDKLSKRKHLMVTVLVALGMLVLGDQRVPRHLLRPFQWEQGTWEVAGRYTLPCSTGSSVALTWKLGGRLSLTHPGMNVPMSGQNSNIPLALIPMVTVALLP